MAGFDDSARGRATGRPQAVDFARPRIPAVYDYLIGGKNHMEGDRRFGDRLKAAWPAELQARENRKFLTRAVHHLAAEAGIRQFLDIGTGYPIQSPWNVHEIAQAIAPESRVAYVDNDPVVLPHLRALMASAPEGQVDCFSWDLRFDDPAKLLSDAVMQGTLDFGEPIAVLLVGVLPFILDEDEPAKTIQGIVDALAPGSYIAASHPTAEHDPKGAAAVRVAYGEAGIPMQFRDSGEFARLAFPGPGLVPPGVVPLPEWRAADGGSTPAASEVSCYGGTAKKR